jgi:hypothetical protein
MLLFRCCDLADSVLSKDPVLGSAFRDPPVWDRHFGPTALDWLPSSQHPKFLAFPRIAYGGTAYSILPHMLFMLP